MRQVTSSERAATFLARLSTWLATRRDVACALLVGSQARVERPADEWSDVDIVLVADEPAALLDDPGWVAELGVPLATFVEPTLLGQRERRVLFSDGLDVDFTVLPPPVALAFLDEQESITGTVLRRGVRVLADRDGLGARVLEIAGTPLAAPAPPSPGEFNEAVNEFWYRVLWTARKLRRGELWLVTESMNGRLRQLVLTQLRWQAEAQGIDAWHEGRFVERWASPEVRARLGAIVAPYDADKLPGALNAIADLFRELATDVAARLDFDYPDELEDGVRALVERTLDGDSRGRGVPDER